MKTWVLKNFILHPKAQKNQTMSFSLTRPKMSLTHRIILRISRTSPRSLRESKRFPKREERMLRFSV